ncbi:hypothetical protein ABZT49_34085 [Methylobacterium sp. EM32]|uniref:hypothetical protein n=1 Tax=Methylobacterium sp. EM32 TaxID=3163481 RepID=UPI0033A86418
MTDAAPSTRPANAADTALLQGPVPTPAQQGAAPAVPAHVSPTQVAPMPATAPAVALPAGVADQLARIEDKASRIEDKYARSEALLARVEDRVEEAGARMNEAARQADLAALRNEVRAIAERTRRLPGAGALIVTAVVTAVLTVALTLVAQRLNLQGLIPLR